MIVVNDKNRDANENIDRCYCGGTGNIRRKMILSKPCNQFY